ncbi:MAG: SRPBCC family protein [Actinomycetota bacterium]
MELTNEFVIDRSVEETWEILNDLEFIAPCMPGAQLQEIEGDEYRGVVKIKVGPISAQYKGKASFVEQDVENRVAKLKAEGRDPRQGNANAMVTATMEPAGEGQTTVNIHTDLGLSGKIASFGRGAIEDVSKKILGQFTENLREKLEEGAAPAADTAANADAGPADAGATAPAATGVAPAPADASPAASTDGGVRKIDSPEAEPVDLLAVSGETVAKRALPAAGGLAIVALILYWLFGRG